MKEKDRRTHWEHIYQTKSLKEVSWYQPRPETSLRFIRQSNLPFTAKIIDVGGGDSFLTDRLLASGYRDITVLDVSETAIERAKKRLGEKAEAVKWIVADASRFQPEEQYDLWHDRATFHFLTEKAERSHYIKAAHLGIKSGGTLVIGTFSTNGPEKCSGLTIQQYSEESMIGCMTPYFEKIACQTAEHKTPFGTIQHFIFCSFKRV